MRSDPTSAEVRTVVQAVSKADEVADRIEADILDSDLASDSFYALRNDLIERYGVSPATLNESLRILRERKVVTVKPGRKGGVHVAERLPFVRLGALDVHFRATSVDAPDLFEARGFLEDMLAQLAVDRAEPADLVGIGHALAVMAAAQGDPHEYLVANWRLHGSIARAAHSPTLSSFYEAIIALLISSISRVVVTDHARYQPTVARNLEVHTRMVESIRAGDHDALAATLQDHLMDTRRPVLGVPRATGGGG